MPAALTSASTEGRDGARDQPHAVGVARHVAFDGDGALARRAGRRGQGFGGITLAGVEVVHGHLPALADETPRGGGADAGGGAGDEHDVALGSRGIAHAQCPR